MNKPWRIMSPELPPSSQCMSSRRSLATCSISASSCSLDGRTLFFFFGEIKQKSQIENHPGRRLSLPFGRRLSFARLEFHIWSKSTSKFSRERARQKFANVVRHVPDGQVEGVSDRSSRSVSGPVNVLQGQGVRRNLSGTSWAG